MIIACQDKSLTAERLRFIMAQMLETDNLEKTLAYGRLLDFYGELLSEKQREAMDLYYNEDLSLAEVAGQLQISRQAVHEHIKHAGKLMSQFEDKLHLQARHAALMAGFEDFAKKLNAEDPELKAALTALKALI